MAQSISDMSVTWPDGSTYNGIKLNVNDAGPSSASSLLMDLQVGSATRFGVAKNGNTRIAGNGYFWVFDTNTTANRLLFSANGVASFCAISDGFLSTNYQFAASSSANADLYLFRDAANTLAQRNGVAAQAFRVYNTFTDASNHERGKIEWSSNVLRIGTEKAGSGTARALEFQTDGATRLTIASTGGSTFGGFLRVDGYLDAKSTIYLLNRVELNAPANGVLLVNTNGTADFGRLQFGGSTSSFPALKRSTTSLQARLADDSAFASIQGKLTTETAYTAGAPTATGYIVLYDSTGTAYKVPAEAL